MIKCQKVAPKPEFCITEQQAPSRPDEGLSYTSSKSICIAQRIRFDRFGKQIDKHSKLHSVSFRDRVTKQQKIYDLFVFEYFKVEKQQRKEETEKKCCSIY